MDVHERAVVRSGLDRGRGVAQDQFLRRADTARAWLVVAPFATREATTQLIKWVRLQRHNLALIALSHLLLLNSLMVGRRWRCLAAPGQWAECIWRDAAGLLPPERLKQFNVLLHGHHQLLLVLKELLVLR